MEYSFEILSIISVVVLNFKVLQALKNEPSSTFIKSSGAPSCVCVRTVRTVCVCTVRMRCLHVAWLELPIAEIHCPRLNMMRPYWFYRGGFVFVITKKISKNSWRKIFGRKVVRHLPQRSQHRPNMTQHRPKMHPMRGRIESTEKVLNLFWSALKMWNPCLKSAQYWPRRSQQHDPT